MFVKTFYGISGCTLMMSFFCFESKRKIALKKLEILCIFFRGFICPSNHWARIGRIDT